jgi:prepilin-type N-terminal cleavage/methylation domain-containing protein
VSISRKPRGFTLIELLVVVAIIGLLMSMLLPHLSRAREQAKTVKCVSNLRSIGSAMLMYAQEEKDWFPFEKRNISYVTPLHAFYYGGHPGRSPWWGFTDANYRDTAAGRPFNKFLYQNLSNRLETTAEAGQPAFEENRKLPLFECPSDTGGFWNTQVDDLESLKPIHFDTGSSYDMNYHFVWQWATQAPFRLKYLQKGNKFLAKQREFHAARFVMLFEDPFDSAQWNNLPRMGWHRQLNRHSFLFLDGHAANVYANTVQGNTGPGWKTSSGDWYNDPEDPDYQYRNLGPY